MVTLFQISAKTAGLFFLIILISACADDATITESDQDQRAVEIVNQLLDEEIEVEKRRKPVPAT